MRRKSEAADARLLDRVERAAERDRVDYLRLRKRAARRGGDAGFRAYARRFRCFNT